MNKLHATMHVILIDIFIKFCNFLYLAPSVLSSVYEMRYFSLISLHNLSGRGFYLKALGYVIGLRCFTIQPPPSGLAKNFISEPLASHYENDLEESYNSNIFEYCPATASQLKLSSTLFLAFFPKYMQLFGFSINPLIAVLISNSFLG